MPIIVKMTITDKQAENAIRGLFENFPEASSGNALQCEDFDNENFLFTFRDTEEDRVYHIGMRKALKGFKRFLNLKMQGRAEGIPGYWGDGDLQDYDSTTCDAIVQLALFGEIIYG